MKVLVMLLKNGANDALLPHAIDERYLDGIYWVEWDDNFQKQFNRWWHGEIDGLPLIKKNAYKPDDILLNQKSPKAMIFAYVNCLVHAPFVKIYISEPHQVYDEADYTSADKGLIPLNRQYVFPHFIELYDIDGQLALALALNDLPLIGSELAWEMEGHFDVYNASEIVDEILKELPDTITEEQKLLSDDTHEKLIRSCIKGIELGDEEIRDEGLREEYNKIRKEDEDWKQSGLSERRYYYKSMMDFLSKQLSFQEMAKEGIRNSIKMLNYQLNLAKTWKEKYS